MNEMNGYFRQRPAKRAFDLAFATLGFIFLSPLFLLGVVLARFQSPGPVFHKGKRVGRGGQVFELYKFRTMVDNAALVGPSLTIYHDPRITPFGQFLRWTKIDELPNLINVVKGDMSLIGPRPEAPMYVQHYTERQKQVLRVRPGITGPSQIANRDEAGKLKGRTDSERYYIAELMPKKLEIDLEYIHTQRLITDCLWLIKTFWVIIFPFQEKENHDF